MEKITVRVLDFAEAPGPRYAIWGNHSGEEFYVKVLNSAMAECVRDNKLLEVLLDGTAGYPSSFLDQAFGELVYDFSVKIVKERVEIVTVINRRRKMKIESETYPQWEGRRKRQDYTHHGQEHFLFFIDENGQLKQRNR